MVGWEDWENLVREGILMDGRFKSVHGITIHVPDGGDAFAQAMAYGKACDILADVFADAKNNGNAHTLHVVPVGNGAPLNGAPLPTKPTAEIIYFRRAA